MARHCGRTVDVLIPASKIAERPRATGRGQFFFSCLGLGLRPIPTAAPLRRTTICPGAAPARRHVPCRARLLVLGSLLLAACGGGGSGPGTAHYASADAHLTIEAPADD